MKKRILFVCSGPGVRARIAEGFLNDLGEENCIVESAQFEEREGRMPEYFAGLVEEMGVEVERALPRSVFERHKNKEVYDYVITLCHAKTNMVCPIFLSNMDTLYKLKSNRLQWSIPDFRSLNTLDPEEKALQAREIITYIKSLVATFVEEHITLDLAEG